MFKVLANNPETITRLYSKNLKNNMILRTLITNDTESLNKLFNTPKMIEAVNDLSNDEFTSMITKLNTYLGMSKKVNNPSSWAGIDTFIKRVVDLDTKSFDNLINKGINFSKTLESAYLNKIIDDNTMIKLLSKLNDELHFKSDISVYAFSNLEIPNINSNNKEINDLINQINLKKNKYNSLKIKESGIKQITVKCDGQTRTIMTDKPDVNLNTDFDFENTEIISIKNFNKIVPENGVNKPKTLYEVEYLINGKMNKDIIYSNEQGFIDLEWPLITKLDDNKIDLQDLKIENMTCKPVTALDIKSKISEKKFTDFKNLFSSNYYGGDQSDAPFIYERFIKKLDLNDTELSKAKTMDKLITAAFPEASEIQKYLLTKAYAENGCHYMALSNAFATYLEKHPKAHQIFENNSTFKLLTDDGKAVNLETMSLDLFIQTMKNYSEDNISIEDLIKDAEGFSIAKLRDYGNEYYQKYGFNINIKTNRDIDLDTYNSAKTPKDEFSKFIYENSNDDNYLVIISKGFDLEYINGPELSEEIFDKALSGKNGTGKIISNIGSHAMLLTDIDENLNPIVSSWSGKFKYLYDGLDVNEDSFLNYYSISFEPK